MVDDKLYDVFWTPDFTHDVMTAVTYIAEELDSPIAAQNLLSGVEDLLDAKRAMPTAAASYVSPSGTTRYVAPYKRWDVYYVIEGNAIKAIGLKHHLQDGGRGALPRDDET